MVLVEGQTPFMHPTSSKRCMLLAATTNRHGVCSFVFTETCLDYPHCLKCNVCCHLSTAGWITPNQIVLDFGWCSNPLLFTSYKGKFHSSPNKVHCFINVLIFTEFAVMCSQMARTTTPSPTGPSWTITDAGCDPPSPAKVFSSFHNSHVHSVYRTFNYIKITGSQPFFEQTSPDPIKVLLSLSN